MTTEQLETMRAAAGQMQGRAGELLRMAIDHSDCLQDKLAAAYAANQHSFDAGEKRALSWYEGKLEHVRAENDSLRRKLEQAGQRGDALLVPREVLARLEQVSGEYSFETDEVRCYCCGKDSPSADESHEDGCPVVVAQRLLAGSER